MRLIFRLRTTRCLEILSVLPATVSSLIRYRSHCFFTLHRCMQTLSPYIFRCSQLRFLKRLTRLFGADDKSKRKSPGITKRRASAEHPS
ncbi:hypothetical protein DFH06DRAFT_1204830 [Mycena polygramma]|nr:hypothetical protein DFH06DRAFT_1204830 [Mycena polygramma]